jgi:hypothetical protein
MFVTDTVLNINCVHSYIVCLSKKLRKRDFKYWLQTLSLELHMLGAGPLIINFSATKMIPQG